MARRSRARQVVLQLLYQEDLNPGHDPAVADRFLRTRLNRDPELIEFARALLAGVRTHRPAIDRQLGKRAANWTLERMAVTDRNVLRLAAFEILYTDTPGRVAINEALELAKRFGAAHSAPFVNGVLDRLLHDQPQGSPAASQKRKEHHGTV
jgi:transcription antitermination protein NusB